MLRKILTALLKNERDQIYLMIIDYLIKENKVIREAYEKTGRRLLLTNEQRRDLAILAKPLVKHGFKHVIRIFTPETLMGWYRKFIGREFDSSKVERKPGRPEIPGWVSRMILKMKRENPNWGCPRIAGQISNLYYKVCEETVRNVLRRHNLEPVPDRDSQGTWSQFLKRHLDVLWATDFFTKTVLTMGGPVTCYVCFFIHLKTRRVVLGGITPNPDAEFMQQIARNLTGFELENARFIIRDQDKKYLPFDAMLPKGMETIVLPPKSPNLNAYAERFVRSIKEECLNKFIPVRKDFLPYIIREYLVHYDTERNHQGDDIGNVLLFPDDCIDNSEPDGEILTNSRLGGLLKFYYRESKDAA